MVSIGESVKSKKMQSTTWTNSLCWRPCVFGWKINLSEPTLKPMMTYAESVRLTNLSEHQVKSGIELAIVSDGASMVDVTEKFVEQKILDEEA